MLVFRRGPVEMQISESGQDRKVAALKITLHALSALRLFFPADITPGH